MPNEFENDKELNEFQEMIRRGREEGKWSEGTEWAQAMKYVHDEIYRKALRLQGAGFEPTADAAIAQACRMIFGSTRYFSLNGVGLSTRDLENAPVKKVLGLEPQEIRQVERIEQIGTSAPVITYARGHSCRCTIAEFVNDICTKCGGVDNG